MFHSVSRSVINSFVKVAVGWSPYFLMRVYQFVGKNQENIREGAFEGKGYDCFLETLFGRGDPTSNRSHG
jgi:hypothetical protein